MNRSLFIRQWVLIALATLLCMGRAWADDEAPDAFIKRVSVDVLDTI